MIKEFQMLDEWIKVSYKKPIFFAYISTPPANGTDIFELL